MQWLRLQLNRERYRLRRACFRPDDLCALQADLTSLANHIVTVRFERIGRANSPYSGQRLYRILDAARAVREPVRPETEFDFLD